MIPKSVHSERIDANIDVFDFQLSEDDMKKIKLIPRDNFTVRFILTLQLRKEQARKPSDPGADPRRQCADRRKDHQ